MLEYFAYKKYKKNKEEKADLAKSQAEASAAATTGDKKPANPAASTPTPSPAAAVTPASTNTAPMQQPAAAAAAPSSGTATPAPVLDETDAAWLERLLSSDEGPAPPLPPRVKTPSISWESSDDERSQDAASGKGKGKEKEKNKGDKTAKLKEGAGAAATGVTGLARNASKRLTLIFSKDKKTGHLAPPASSSHAVADPRDEEAREQRDLSAVLDDLSLAAKNDKAFSLSADSTELVRKFTLVLKDIVNGVPTAYGDLTALLEDKDGVLAKKFDSLPKSLRKLVEQLPAKLKSTIAPELLAAASAAGAEGGLKGAAKSMFVPTNLKEIVTKPGAVVGMLKAIMNALKMRWPAFMGTNVIWSVAVFLLLFVLWYCHKRGRETRLEREASQNVIDGSSRIEELPDDPALPAPRPEANRPAFLNQQHSSQVSPMTEVPSTAQPAAKPARK